MINGLPVVTAPAEIDATTADKLQTVLLEAVENGHATIVVDLTGTRFCDSFGLRVLGAAHRRALEERGELRLVLPAGGPRCPCPGPDHLGPLHPLLHRPRSGPGRPAAK